MEYGFRDLSKAFGARIATDEDLQHVREAVDTTLGSAERLNKALEEEIAINQSWREKYSEDEHTAHMVPGIAYDQYAQPLPMVGDDPKLVDKALREYRKYERRQRRKQQR